MKQPLQRRLLLMTPFPISALHYLPLIFFVNVKPKSPRYLGLLAGLSLPLSLPLDKEDTFFVFFDFARYLLFEGTELRA